LPGREVAWHDFQVLLNSYSRKKKILKLPVLNETAAEAATWLALRREYKEALQIHEQHIRDEAELRVSELETEIVAAAIAKRGEAHVQKLRRQSDSSASILEAYRLPMTSLPTPSKMLSLRVSSMHRWTPTAGVNSGMTVCLLTL
jgi:hypothetical protein